MGMRFLDLTLPTLAENLALDEALLLAAEEGGREVLRLWEWPAAAVVLGAAGRLREEVDEAACRAAGVPILRRASGGGTVLLGAGCLVFTLVLKYSRAVALTEVRPSYRYILGRIKTSLAKAIPGLELAGISDLAWEGCKVSGNAQQRKRRHLLHHGTLLYAFDLTQVGLFLRPPPRQPAYRQDRDHGAFLRNLPVTAAELRRRLQRAWKVQSAVGTIPEDKVRQLASTKYISAEWIYRR